MLSLHGLRIVRVATDKRQPSSLLLAFLAPVIWLARRMQFGGSELARKQNSAPVLFGRKLVIVAQKVPDAATAERPQGTP